MEFKEHVLKAYIVVSVKQDGSKGVVGRVVDDHRTEVFLNASDAIDLMDSMYESFGDRGMDYIIQTVEL
jgi:hypothetical protein